MRVKEPKKRTNPQELAHKRQEVSANPTGLETSKKLPTAFHLAERDDYNDSS
jgi:hypothetical protein